MAHLGRKVWTGIGLFSVTAMTLAGICSRTVAAETPTGIVTVVTEPSKRSQMSFPVMGVIKQVVVKEGEIVKKGQPLMVQDLDIERAELERLKGEADSTARVDYYQADLDLKKKIYDRKHNAEGGAFSNSEIEEAQADVVKGERQIDVAKLDHKGDIIKSQQQQLKVDKMTLRSEMDGVVESIKSWEGELATPEKDKPVVIVVRNDPCYVVINLLRTYQVARLRLGQSLEVKYPEDQEWQQAKIIFIDPVADARSDTQTIKLELPNPQNKATGLPIQVKLPPDVAAAGNDRTASR